MRRPTLPRKAILALLVVAVLGPGAALTLLGAGDSPADVAAAALAAAANPDRLEDPLAADPAPGVVVVARTSDWVKYLDLVIKVLALLLAWLMNPKPAPAPEKRPSADR